MEGKGTQVATTLHLETKKKQSSNSKTKKHTQTSKSSAYELAWTPLKEK